MLDYTIQLVARREAIPASRVTIHGDRTGRWPHFDRERRGRWVAVAAAVMLHVAGFAIGLIVVRHAALLPVPEEQSIALIFAPPAAADAAAPEDAAIAAPPPVAPPPVAPPQQPAAAAPEPPAEPTEPPPAAPAEAPPPAVQAETPPPAAQAETPPPPVAEPAPAPPVPAAKPSPPKPEMKRPHPPALRPPAATAKPEAAPGSAVAEQTPPQPARQPPAGEAPIPADWQRSFSAWLDSHRTYPPLAVRRRIEGSVVVRFTADRSGHVSDITVVHSAGSDILDDAAISLVQHAPMPAFTASMQQDTVTVTVPIRYALTN